MELLGHLDLLLLATFDLTLASGPSLVNFQVPFLPSPSLLSFLTLSPRMRQVIYALRRPDKAHASGPRDGNPIPKE